MKLSLTAYLALALVLSLIGNAAQLYLAGGQKPKCELEQATETIQADKQVRKEENVRDKKLDAVDRNTKADTNKAVTKVEEQTHERAAAIDRVPVVGSCRAPVGLPDLGPAVDQANAAAGD